MPCIGAFHSGKIAQACAFSDFRVNACNQELRQPTNRTPAGVVPPVGLPTKLADKGLVAGSVDCRPRKCHNFSTR